MYKDDSKFVIRKNSNRSMGFVFLVDRRKTKKKWWTKYISEAMRFESEYAANKQCEKLRYGNPTVCLASEFYVQ